MTWWTAISPAMSPISYLTPPNFLARVPVHPGPVDVAHGDGQVRCVGGADIEFAVVRVEGVAAGAGSFSVAGAPRLVL